MCGIAGLLGIGAATDLVRSMLDLQRHRGPDGDGIWRETEGKEAKVVLGHRRLSILDLSERGAQPMEDGAGRYVLTYNGEIYNYLELRSELRALGHVFHTDTDTEVILEAYKAWGEDCLQRFNGMFAFALYDKVEQRLLCARDRYGEKPFLFHRSAERFVFASEYKSLLLDPEIPLDFDEWRLIRAAHNPSTGLDADRQTVFKAVEQLLPGEAMSVDVDRIECKIWRYWQIEPGELREEVDERAVFTEFRDLLTDAVRLRLRSDVPVGSCLSGGLDSSAIVCLVRKLLGDDAPYHTFTGRFPGTAADEWLYAEQVVKCTGVITHVTEPTVDRFLDELPQFIWYNELPVGGSSQFAQWCVFKLAAENGVTVLLDGQGADEVLGGYEQYFGYYVEALRQRGEGDRLARELSAIRDRYPLALTPPARQLRDRLPYRLRHLIANQSGKGTSLLYGVHPGVGRRLQSDNRLANKPGFNALSNALEQDSFGRFLSTLLRYGDRNSMAHSREVRLPFCDHRIAEFVFGLPPHLLMGEVQTKRLLRESMAGVLPEGIRTRWNKQGFRPPQDLWFQSPRMLALAEATFDAPEFRHSEFWHAPWWHRALSRARRGEQALGSSLWQPLMVEQWKRHFLEPIRQQRRQLARTAAA
jgi:asparagine synthase (glutamine-hydrolysing)